MPKLYTRIGFAPSFTQTAPGVWEEVEVIKNYYGEILRNARRLENSGQLNDNINVNNRISILSDPYARENFHSIRWIEFMGTKWKVSDVEVEYPRLIFTIGGIYNADNDTPTNGTTVSA